MTHGCTGPILESSGIDLLSYVLEGSYVLRDVITAGY